MTCSKTPTSTTTMDEPISIPGRHRKTPPFAHCSRSGWILLRVFGLHPVFCPAAARPRGPSRELCCSRTTHPLFPPCVSFCSRSLASLELTIPRSDLAGDYNSQTAASHVSCTAPTATSSWPSCGRVCNVRLNAAKGRVISPGEKQEMTIFCESSRQKDTAAGKNKSKIVALLV